MKLRFVLLPATAAVLTAAVMLLQSRGGEPELTDERFPRLEELAGWKSETLAPSAAELETLPKDTIFDRRRYRAPNGDWMLVSLVIGGKNKSSLHRPEICLPSQGAKMSEPRTLAAGGVDWHALKLERGTEAPLAFAYTFYNQAGYRTSSHVARIFRDVLDRSFLGRIDRWAMLTVVAPEVRWRGLETLLKPLAAYTGL